MAKKRHTAEQIIAKLRGGVVHLKAREHETRYFYIFINQDRPSG
jgi:hypothetical protein